MPDSCLTASQCQPLVRTLCTILKPRPCDSACPADARPPKPCGVVTASGGQGTTRTRHGLGPDPGLVSIDYQMFSVPDRLDCYYQGVLVATTGGLVSGTGTLTWAYSPALSDPQWCLVIVSAPQSGTAWTYTIGCPA